MLLNSEFPYLPPLIYVLCHTCRLCAFAITSQTIVELYWNVLLGSVNILYWRCIGGKNSWKQSGNNSDRLLLEWMSQLDILHVKYSVSFATVWPEQNKWNFIYIFFSKTDVLLIEQPLPRRSKINVWTLLLLYWRAGMIGIGKTAVLSGFCQVENSRGNGGRSCLPNV